jgi:hypothetical protein
MAASRSALVSIQSRECSPALLERLAGSTLFPERPLGAAIVTVLGRSDRDLLYVTAPGLADADEQVDYFLDLAAGPAGARPARDRVEVVGVEDRSARWLSTKLLDPDSAVAGGARARVEAFVTRHQRAGGHVELSYFEPSENLERLAARLGIGGDQTAARHIPLGTKAAGRQLLREADVEVPDGTDEQHDLAGLRAAVAELAGRGHRRLVVKLSSTEYGAGLGNAVFTVADGDLARSVLMDPKLSWADFASLIPGSGVLAEELIEGAELRSPSFQGRVDPAGAVSALSTHDQVLAPNGQTYTGSAFPAAADYRADVLAAGLRVGARLRDRGVRGGDYGVDFIVVRRDGGWRTYGCEVNLRATGTKHGLDMVCALLGVRPDAAGRLITEDGERFYTASDGIAAEHYRGLRPAAVIAAVRNSDLHWDQHGRTGVTLHMLGALPDYGKFGAVCVGRSRAEAAELATGLRALVDALAREPVSPR